MRPDLAADLPTVSADGLTWTFRLREGIRYAPPLADRAIEARDFVTAIEHVVVLADAPFFDDVVGVPEFREGTADTIAGVDAPDALTLVVRLIAPAGDLGNRMATPLAAPLPAEALTGRDHTDYAGFLVASGPYMYEGAGALDLADAGADPIWSGHEDGPVVLVRNPSWDPATDGLRGAYVDRIEASLVESPEAAAEAVDAGDVDLMGEPAPLELVRRYLDSSDLRSRIYTQNSARVHYLAMNLAVPPFDDPRVRRAVNLVIDRAAATEAISEERGSLTDVAHHTIPDVLESNLLLTYAPFATTGDHGDTEAAQAEMRESAYDSDGDGRCDAVVCHAVLTVPAGGAPLTDIVAASLAEIGIVLTPDEDANLFDPAASIGAVVGIGWGADYPNAANFGPLFGQRGLADLLLNFSLLGATPDQLAGWGYEVTEVPQLEPRVEACIAAIGSDVFRCWAELDQLLTERIMPWVPLGFVRNAWITSDRVVAFSPDVNSVGPALDQIRVRLGD